MDYSIQRFLEYRRLVAEVELTEEGTFVVGEIPEDYAGSVILRIEVCYAMVLVGISGRTQFISYNPPDVMNKNREKGLPIQMIDGGREVRAGVNSPVVEVQWKINANLPNLVKQKADAMWAMTERELGEWVI